MKTFLKFGTLLVLPVAVFIGITFYERKKVKLVTATWKPPKGPYLPSPYYHVVMSLN